MHCTAGMFVEGKFSRLTVAPPRDVNSFRIPRWITGAGVETRIRRIGRCPADNRIAGLQLKRLAIPVELRYAGDHSVIAIVELRGHKLRLSLKINGSSWNLEFPYFRRCRCRLHFMRQKQSQPKTCELYCYRSQNTNCFCYECCLFHGFNLLSLTTFICTQTYHTIPPLKRVPPTVELWFSQDITNRPADMWRPHT